MTALYDFRATPLVNLIADRAVNLRNACLAEDPNFLIDMRKACAWSVDAVVPLADRSTKTGLAYEALIVVQHALALDRMVPAVRGRAA